MSSLTARGDDGAGRTSVVRLDREGRCSGIHHKEEGRVDVLRLRGAFYIRLNAAEIRRNGRADWSPAVAEEKVGRFAGRWMEMNPQAGPFQGLARACDPTHFSGRLEEMARGLEEGRPGFRELRREPADLRGEPVIRVTAPQGPAVLSVSTGRKPYLVALDEGPRVRASFEDFGEPVVAEHPDPADLESFLDFIGQARDTGPARTAGARHATAITK
ncbi:hypothetical protein [Streptomyces clavuligerus]|uniref:hypothetical protein n=1 Tax=Streptomyces clavuligerus TaxID=1901 RepID=UPI001F367776|nr:hypothetical protein [Streptomyces clavuligerus]